MKKIIALALLLCSVISVAQKKESNWKKEGLFTVLFNQSAYNKEWQGGGVNNLATNLNINYNLNYKKDDVVWDNNIMLAYGVSKLAGNSKFQKTDDRINFSSTYGKQTSKYWYISAYLNFKSQFANGYKTASQANKITSFFSPAYLQAGPGALWKKSDNLKINITPASARAIFVSSQFTQTGSSFGVVQGKTSRFELGADIAAYYKIAVVKNVTFENILNLYANYLQKFGNIDIDYKLNIAMQINDYLSTNVAFQAIYDDNAVKAFQIKEIFGVGLNYNF